MNLEERIDVMVRLGRYLADVDSPELKEVKQQAFEKNRWFTEEFIDLAFRNIAAEYLDREKLNHWVNHYHVDDNITPLNVGIVMAGNIPLVGFHDFLSVFISGHNQKIKLSDKDSVLMKHVAEKIVAYNSKASSRIGIMDMLKDCNAYIATGSNNSSRYFNYYFGKYPSVIRGNKTSVAILSGTETPAELELLADDVYSYFGLGCRNVTKIFVPENYDFVPMLQAFRKYNCLSDHTKYRNNYDYNLALLIMNNKYYMTNDTIILTENDDIFSPVSELHYSYYKNLATLQTNLPALDSIQSISGANFTPLGQSQKPELFDYADGIDTMAFLLGL